MKKISEIMVAMAMVLAIFVVDGRAAEMSRIEKINVREESGRVSIEFKGSERLRYRVKEYDSPPHFLVQFFNTASGLPYEKVQVNKGNVSDISVKQIRVNGETSTFMSVHLKEPSDFDFDLAPNGQTFRLAVAGKGAGSDTIIARRSENVNSGGANTTASEPRAELDGSYPIIQVPGEKKGSKGTTQIPYAYKPPSEFNEVEIPYKMKDLDTSPYIVGPVILQDADVSQAIRLLSESAGGANIVVQSSLVATKGGITVTLSHITLEDALDIITSSNNWTWRKFGDYYSIMDKNTAMQGVNTVKSGTMYEDTANKMKVVILQPQFSYACRLMSHLQAVIPDVGCDKSKNLLILRGVENDIARAKELLKALDTANTHLTTQPNQVTRLIKFKYIQMTEAFKSELASILVNPYFGGLVIGGGANADKSQDVINSITFDSESSSIVFVGNEEIYNRFFSLVQQLDVPSRQTVVKVIPLKYATVKDVQKMEEIDKYVGTVRSDGKNVKVLYSEATNTITYIGPEEDFERIDKIIGSIDIEDRRYVTEVIKLKYVSAVDLETSEIMDKITMLPGFGTGTKEGATTNVKYDLQTNSIIISSQKQYIENLKNLIVSMDRNQFEIYEFETFRLKYVGTARAINILGSLMSAAQEKGKYPGDGDFFVAPELKTGETFSKEYHKQANKWSVYPNFADNSMYALARPGDMEMIKRIIKDIDVRTDQLKIDVQFVELNRNDESRFKLGYVTKDGKLASGGNVDSSYYFHNYEAGGSKDFFEGSYVVPEDKTMNEYKGGFLAYNTLTNFPAAFSSVLDVLISKINGRIVANPSVMATEANPVTFDFSERLPYAITSFGQIEIRTAHNGFIMTLTPHFKDNYIVLDLVLNVAEITGYMPSTNYPIESAREVTTQIKCESGVPFIIGGMVRSQESNTKVTFPILSDLPVVGSLFKQKKKNVDEFEVVMVITPTVISVND